MSDCFCSKCFLGVHVCFVMVDFALKCLQFTVDQWNDEKAAQLTFLQRQVRVCHFSLRVYNNILSYIIIYYFYHAACNADAV